MSNTSSKIPAAITTLAGAIAAGMTVAVDGAVAAVTVAPDLYTKNLPVNVTEEAAKALHEYSSNFYAAAAKATGDVALDTMKKHKKVEEVAAEFPLLGKDVWAVKVERSATNRNPGTGEEVVSYGALSGKLVTQDARGNRGLIKHVREELQASALAAFGK